MMNNKQTKGLLVVVVVLLLAVVAYGALTMPDRRNTAEKVGDAIHELPQGVDKAARQLEDRTPGEKIGDAVKDVGDEIKDSTNR